MELRFSIKKISCWVWYLKKKMNLILFYWWTLYQHYINWRHETKSIIWGFSIVINVCSTCVCTLITSIIGIEFNLSSSALHNQSFQLSTSIYINIANRARVCHCGAVYLEREMTCWLYLTLRIMYWEFDTRHPCVPYYARARRSPMWQKINCVKYLFRKVRVQFRTFVFCLLLWWSAKQWGSLFLTEFMKIT